MINILNIIFYESLKNEYYPCDKLKILSYKIFSLKEIEPSIVAQLNYLYAIYRKADAIELAKPVKKMLSKIEKIRKEEQKKAWESVNSTPAASPLPASPPSNSPGPSSVTAALKPI